MMDNKLKVAFAQINYHPAYVGVNGNYIDEPSLVQEGEQGILSLPKGVAEVSTLKSHIRMYYLSNLRSKLTSIMDYCSQKGIDLLVFPEYSIPVELLSICYQFAIKKEMIIVAGSHSVVVNQQSREQYEEVDLLKDGNLGGVESLEDCVRKAICPVFTPNGSTYVSKLTQSSWEGEMIVDDKWNLILIDYPGISVKLAIILCIDSISHQNQALLVEKGVNEADVIVIPSYSPSTTPFKQVALNNLINEKPTVYCNTAEYGGSKIFAFHGKRSGSLYLENDGTKAAGKYECVVATELDLKGQFDKRSAKTYFPVKEVFFSPIIYSSKSPIINSYCVELQEVLEQFSSANVESLLDKYIELFRFVPHTELLFENINKIRDMIFQGLATNEEKKLLIDGVMVNASYLDIHDLRSSLVRYASDFLTRLMPKINDRSTILEQLVELDKKEKYLNSINGVSRKLNTCDPFTLEIYNDSELPTTDFVDRGGAFDNLSSFINNSEKKVFYLDGSKGIGKTAFVEEFFKKKLKNIKPAKILITKSMSFERFLSSLCEVLKISLDPRLFIEDYPTVIKVVKETLIKSKQILILDEFQFFITHNGSFYDNRVGDFLGDVLQGKSNLKLILISDINLPLPEKIKVKYHPYTMPTLRGPYIFRIIENCLRTMDLLEGIETPKVPAELLNLIEGHPLAAIICATLYRSFTFEQLISDVKPKLHFRNKVIKALLQKNQLDERQLEIIYVVSVFNRQVPLKFFESYFGGQVHETLESLQRLYLIQRNEDQYFLHPLIKDHYLQQIHDKRSHLHLEIAKYCKNVIDKEGFFSQPNILADYIYHSAQAGQEVETNEYLKVYKEELRPAGIYAYRLGSYDTAEKYFKILIEFNPSDWDAHYRFALCYLKRGKTDVEKAREHFNKAIELNDSAWWIYQSFGSAMMRFSFEEAESYINIAYDMAPNEVAVLCSMGRLILKRLKPDVPLGISYYRAAINKQPSNMFIYEDLIRQLIKLRRDKDAVWYLNKALKIEPQNKELLGIKELLSSDVQAGIGFHNEFYDVQDMEESD